MYMGLEAEVSAELELALAFGWAAARGSLRTRAATGGCGFASLPISPSLLLAAVVLGGGCCCRASASASAAAPTSRSANMTPAPGDRVGDQLGDEGAGEPEDEEETMTAAADLSATGGGDGATGGVGVRESGR